MERTGQQSNAKHGEMGATHQENSTAPCASRKERQVDQLNLGDMFTCKHGNYKLVWGDAYISMQLNEATMRACMHTCTIVRALT
jgi:hypothetical protein